MRRPLPVVEMELEDHRSNVHELVLDRVAAARLWHEIGRLPQQQRDAVLLREIAGLSYEELGVLLGVTRPAVESLLFRARSHLRDRLRAVLASLNIAGLVSEAAAAVARLAGSGAAPVAVKAAAVGVGVAVVGGGGVVAERRLELPAAGAQSSRRVADAAPMGAPVPAPAPVRSRVSLAAPRRPERHGAPIVHVAALTVTVAVERHEVEPREIEHREVEHSGLEPVDEERAPRGDHGRDEPDDGRVPPLPLPPPPPPPPTVTTTPAPVEHVDASGEREPATATTTTVAREVGTPSDGGHEGPGPGTPTIVAVPSSSGDGSSGDHHGAAEGGSSTVLEADGDGGGADEAETTSTGTTTTTSAEPTTTTSAEPTTTTATTTTEHEGGDSGSGDGGGHSGPH